MVDKKLKIYLAGWTGEVEYRRWIHSEYEEDFDIIDPMAISKDYVEIAPFDKHLIMNSDVVVAYVRQPSWGTAMEICFSYDHNKLVFIIDPTEQMRKDPWVSFHCHKFFDSIESCYELLKNFDGREFLIEKF